MKAEEIIHDILKGMEGIGGVPSNHEFYVEFDFRLRSALGIEPVNERLKAEEIAQRYSLVDIYGNASIDVVEAMKEYARIQIEKDRERIKEMISATEYEKHLIGKLL